MKVSAGASAAEQLAALARDLRQAKDRDLQKALYRGLTKATAPIRRAAQADTGRLPQSGGRGVRSYSQKTGRSTVKKKGYAYRAPVATGRSRIESLGARAAKARFGVKPRVARGAAVLTLRAYPAKGSPANLNNLDDGFVMHPLFGDRKHWYRQSVTSGWFSDAVTANVDEVRDECLAAVDDVLAQLRAKG